MKVLVFLACFIVAITANDYQQWVSFKAKHSKQYKIVEDKLRFQVFQQNLREIEEHNARYVRGEVGWYKGVNAFADWTKEEFQALLTRQAASRPQRNESLGLYVADPNVKAPSSIDWRNKGAVLPVRDQGLVCGSCWAFSSTGAVEGQLAIHKNQKIPLSPQNLIDCSDANLGCDGGDQVLAFQFIKSDGISAEADYPYKAKDQSCKKNVQKAVKSLSGYKHLRASEDDLISAIANVGPISVSVDASIWQSYAGGVYDDENCGSNINHAILAVGYTDKYIIIKNSWGTSWGESGYIRLARGSNICSINDDNSYPIL